MKELEINFDEIIKIIESRKNNAYKKVNEELIALYWDFGKYISIKINDAKWGNKIVDKLEEFMKREYPTLKGFNRAGIYRMKQFYETYNQYPEIVSTVLRQISWSNHIQILSSTKTIEERIFYINLAIKERYSARELARQIESGYYERYLLSDDNALFSKNELVNEDEIPNHRFLDTYSLEFLDLPNVYSEKDLRKAIIANMKNFILEIGKDLLLLEKNIESK